MYQRVIDWYVYLYLHASKRVIDCYFFFAVMIIMYVNGLDCKSCILKKLCFKKIQFDLKISENLAIFIERQAIILNRFKIKFIPAYCSY